MKPLMPSPDKELVFEFLDNGLRNTEGFKDWEAKAIFTDMRDSCCGIEHMCNEVLLSLIIQWKRK